MEKFKKDALKDVLLGRCSIDILIGDIVFTGYRCPKYSFQMPVLSKNDIIGLAKEILNYTPPNKRSRYLIFREVMSLAIERDKAEKLISFIFRDNAFNKKSSLYNGFYKEKTREKAINSLNNSLLKHGFLICNKEGQISIISAEYDRGYVAFLDILGFTNKVGSKVFHDIFDAFQIIKSERKNSDDNLTAIETRIVFFSDSIIVTSHELSSVVSISSQLSLQIMSLLNLGVRGGISYGQYFHRGSVVFGPAIIDAYELEKKAEYSRIIMKKEDECPWHDFLFTDKTEDFYSINIFNEVLSYSTDSPFIELNKNREWILEMINNYEISDNEKIRKKYSWLIKPFNATCKFYANGNGISSLYIDEKLI